MTREIKFRATYKGEIVAYIRITPDEDGNLHTSWNTTNEGGWILTEPPKHDNLDQFTGLLDKNEKEIYGGDILQYISETNHKKTIIEWNESVFTVGWNIGKGLGRQRWEVIGNIYNDPDLRIV